MQEYWVNFWWDYKTLGIVSSTPHRNEVDAHRETRFVKVNYNFGCPYRIHVKMDGGYNRQRARYQQAIKDLNNGKLIRPMYSKDKLNWMG